jgi:hypothetical protein
MAQNLVHFLCVMGSVAEAQQRHGIAIGMDGQCIEVQQPNLPDRQRGAIT